jgi:O-antigen/teichoic acid export membrane protein
LRIFQHTLSKYGRYLSNLSATFLSQAASALSIILLTPVLLRNLGEEQFSIYGVLLNVFVFATIFDFGLNIGLLRRLIHQRENALPLINSSFFFFLALFFLSIPLYYFLYRQGTIKSGGNFLLTALFTALIVFQNILAIFFEMILQSVNKISVSKVVRVGKTVIDFGALFFASRSGSIIILLLTSSIINFLFLGALFFFSKKEVAYEISFGYFKISVLADHIQYCLWYFQNSLASALVFSAQVIMMSSFLDSNNVTKYLLVTRFFDVIRLGMANFSDILLPSLSGMQKEKNWLLLKRMFIKVFWRITGLVIIIFAIVLTFGERLFIFWTKYNDNTTLVLFRLYGIFVALLLIEHVAVVFLSALKFNRLPSIVAIVQGILGLLFSYLLIPYYGITGVVIGSLFAFLITNFFFNPIYLLKQIKSHIQG